MKHKLTHSIPAGFLLLLAIPSVAQNPDIAYDRPTTVTLHELSHRVPRRASREFAVGMKASANNNQQDAIIHLKKAISLDPEYVSAVNDLGVIYLELEQSNLAIEQFGKAIAVDPRAAFVYFNLAVAYFIQRDYRDCERVARQFLCLDPAATRGMLILGIALMLQNKFTAEAELSLRRAAQEFPVAEIYLGVGLLNKGNIEGAREQVMTYFQSGGKDEETIQKAKHLMESIERAAQTKHAGSPIASAVDGIRGSTF